MARKGARVVREDVTERRPEREQSRRPPSRHEEEVWVFTGEVEEPPRPAPSTQRGGRPAAQPELPEDVAVELTAAVGREQGSKLAQRLAAAGDAYARDRYQDAARMAKAIVDQVPESAAARELFGLACYRLGRWREAIRHLETARALAGDDASQLPVLMDCRRALGQHRRVAELWEELRGASPDADVLAEGRLVLASDLADRGDLHQAVELLSAAGAMRRLRHPAERHVRQWYVLADLLERAGDVPRARDLFSRVVEADPELADAPARLAALGRGRGRARGQAAGTARRPGPAPGRR